MYFMTEVAKKKLKEPEGWEVCQWTRIGDTNDFVVKGGIPRILKSGKNKGNRRWDGVKHEAVVTESEMKAEALLYEETTGNCSQCAGTGQQWAGWKSGEGTKYRTCTRCSGSGKRKAQP